MRCAHCNAETEEVLETTAKKGEAFRKFEEIMLQSPSGVTLSRTACSESRMHQLSYPSLERKWYGHTSAWVIIWIAESYLKT